MHRLYHIFIIQTFSVKSATKNELNWSCEIILTDCPLNGISMNCCKFFEKVLNIRYQVFILNKGFSY